MKKFNIGSLILTLAVAIGLMAPALRAQSQSPSAQSPSAQSPSAQSPSAQQSPSPTAQSAQTFTGEIAKSKSGDKLVLKDMASKTEYELDDQDKAKTYEGKSVKVTGTLDAQTNTIHVSDIQPAAS